MRLSQYISGLMILLTCGCGSTPLPENPMMVGGIQINEPDVDQWVSTVKAAGMNTVEVTVYGRNGDWNSQWMNYEAEEPFVLKEIRAAKKEGLKVVLILRMALDHYYPANKFLWHGMIFPETREALDSWFGTYTEFISKWAKIAEEEDIEALVIGSELNALARTIPSPEIPPTIAWFADSSRHRKWEERALRYEDQLRQQDLWVRGFPNYETPRDYIRDKVNAHWEWASATGFGLKAHSVDSINARKRLLHQKWKQSIKIARSHYSGLLSYAANFDNYQDVAFWEELDFIGINAYFPLSSPKIKGAANPPDKNHLKLRWLDILTEIDSFRLAQGIMDKPVVFTELGYTYRENSTLQPWKSDGFSVVGKETSEQLIVWQDQAIDRSSRVKAVNALYDAVKETLFPLHGILYWKLTMTPYLVKEEPYALLISEPATDSLQVSLSRFMEFSRREP